jgi:hypothetical protein
MFKKTPVILRDIEESSARYRTVKQGEEDPSFPTRDIIKTKVMLNLFQHPTR